MEEVEIKCICSKLDDEKTIPCMDCGYHFHTSCVGLSDKHAEALGTFSCKFCCSFSDRLFLLTQDKRITKLVKNNSFDHLKMHITETRDQLERIEKHIQSVEAHIGKLETELIFNKNVKPAYAAKLKYLVTEKMNIIKKLMEYNIPMAKFHTFLEKHKMGQCFVGFMENMVWDKSKIDEMKKKLDDFIHENGKKPIILNK